MNSIDLLFENVSEPSWSGNIKTFVLEVLKRIDITNWEFSLTFCDDSYIQMLNCEYRGKDIPTDVLTFAQIDDPLPFTDHSDFHSAGDIIISLDTLVKNADYFDVEKEEELKRLVIHGILHLKGLDHSDNSPDQEMLVLQEKILKQLIEVKIF